MAIHAFAPHKGKLKNETNMFTMIVVNAHEFKRWLTKRGVTFGTVEGIKKQLGLKGK